MHIVHVTGMYIHLHVHTIPPRRLQPAMGLLCLVESIKLKVSFAEYRLFYRALLQQRPMILSILLTKATPYLPLLQPAPVYTCADAHVQVIFAYICVYVYMHVCL